MNRLLSKSILHPRKYPGEYDICMQICIFMNIDQYWRRHMWYFFVLQECSQDCWYIHAHRL